MEAFVVCKGTPSVKAFYKTSFRETRRLLGPIGPKIETPQKFMATPCVVVESNQVGVGLISEEGKIQYWGLLSPIRILQSWRAMKILEHVDDVFGTHYADAGTPAVVMCITSTMRE
mgnify:CR=1 FL=1